MLEQYTRKHYQRWLVDRVADVAGLYLSPKQITLMAGVAGLAAFLFLMNGFPVTAVAFLLISGYADSLDGTVARRYEKASPAGAVFDIMTDRLVEFAVILGLFLVDPIPRGFMCMMMLGGVLLCVSSFLVVGIFSVNASEKSFHYSVGLMERAEAFILFIFMILLPAHFFSLAIVFITLIMLTTIIRLIEFGGQTL